MNQFKTWINLINYVEEHKNEGFRGGTVFRCKAKYPYEDWVDFMLINYPEAPSGHALIVASGYKAGHILIKLPTEAKMGNTHGIAAKWLIENWQKWIYEMGPQEVYFRKTYNIAENWKTT